MFTKNYDRLRKDLGEDVRNMPLTLPLDSVNYNAYTLFSPTTTTRAEDKHATKEMDIDGEEQSWDKHMVS